ncbi:hypothetical protein MLD38_003294 [Melastoma candidum]|uniref:Uncharacterized protein n=1 Tax=Melastoma candidum TaxID=119954 RepID=A0ACB9S1T2_9MYRT|nr:hypothetical protein MLD38_003294 [Melastoma candidum]
MALQTLHQQEGRDSCSEDDVEARAVLCLVEVVEQSRDSGRLDSAACNDDCIKVELEKAGEDYSHCIVLDIVPESCSQAAGCRGEHHGSNVDNLPTNMLKVFQRQTSLKTEKPAAEKVTDSSNNKWRKYKRAASFDSRKVVILFSVLSIIGSLVLIYLTLRVKLYGDSHGHTS